MSMPLLPGHLFGESLRSRQVANFMMSERCYQPHYAIPRHSHNQALFCFVLQGCYTETYGNKIRECKPSTLLFHPAEEMHAEHFHQAGGHAFIIEVEPKWLKGLGNDLVLEEDVTNFNSATLECLVRKMYREFAAPDEASPLIVEGLMLEIFGETLRLKSSATGGASPRWLQQARELLDARFRESLHLTEVGKLIGIHPVHLAQTFHKFYRCTVGEYVRKLRIEYARQQLEKSELPIVDIALAAGFCDQSHFSRTFKRLTGVAPSRYRESVRRLT